MKEPFKTFAEFERPGLKTTPRRLYTVYIFDFVMMWVYLKGACLCIPLLHSDEKHCPEKARPSRSN